MNLLSSLEILQIRRADASKTCVRAVNLLGQLARKCGATVLVAPDFPNDPSSFEGRDKQVWQPEGGQTPSQWAASNLNRLLLVANTNDDLGDLVAEDEVSAVVIGMDSWESEATLFAQSGLADLLGDPDDEPLVPVGHYAAGGACYAGFCGLSAVYNIMQRHERHEIASVNGLAAIAWINWKAACAGVMGKDLHRQGKKAEWPVMECKDGYAAFVYNERDWPSVVAMTGDERLNAPEFETFAGRQENREAYMSVIREWMKTKTKAELSELFAKHAIPSAPVLTPSDLLTEPLYVHRKAFIPAEGPDGKTVQSAVPPHRIARQEPADSAPPKKDVLEHITPAGPNLPLSGVRVLDMGIITAGAGSGGLLADMGAEVLKIESERYPDPFRKWAGSDDSPFFKFNNRNKYGLGIDLKTEEGKATFLKLVESADVVMENYRRGVLDRMGFSLDVLRKVNPRIVVASISGCGLDGPGSENSSFGSTLEASSGFAALTRDRNGKPYITGRNVNFPDQTVCLYAAAAIALAVQASKANNCALHVDTSQRDVTMYLAGDVIEMVSAGLADDPNSLREAIREYELEGIYKTADERYIALSVPELSALNELAGLENIDGEAALADWAKGQKASAIEKLLRPAGIGAAKVLMGSEMYALETVQSNGVFTHTATGNMVKGFPFKLHKVPAKIWADAPIVGQHNAQFLGEEHLTVGESG